MSPPSAGFSILMTSAPRSANCIDPYGPAPYCSTAITRRPERIGSIGYLSLQMSLTSAETQPHADRAPRIESASSLWSSQRRVGSHLVPGDQLAGDDDALQFVGTLANDEERRVAVEALDGKFLGIAVAAVNAHRLEAATDGGFGSEQLCHAGLHVAALAAVIGLRRALDEQARSLDLRRHVGELELDRLVLADWL